MSKIKVAVFPVAGMGSRFLPATKAVAKEMLPVVDKPLIQYAVEEAVEAGVETLVFITSRHKRAIEDHFDKAYELESELAERGKDKLLAAITDIVPPHVKLVFIRQPEALGLGHAVLCAQPAVGNQPFAVLLPDDMVKTDGLGCLGQMAQAHGETGASILAVQDVPREMTKQYGVVDAEVLSDKLSKVEAMVEKPNPEEAPSTLVVIGRYILDGAIFDYLENTRRGAGNEIQLTDAIAAMLADKEVMAFNYEGVRYDCGSKLGHLQANVDYALSHPELAESFAEFLRSRV